jgi:hypothetical protein
VRLRVISVDEEAARLLRSPLTSTHPWSVHARFERALILASPVDGAMLSVARHDLADGPFTARLALDAPRDLRSIEGAGDGVHSEPPEIDATDAATWRPRRVDPSNAADPAEVDRRLRQLGDIARRADAGARGIHAVAAARDLDGLRTALASRDPRAAAAAAERLAGLGPGLTDRKSVV